MPDAKCLRCRASIEAPLFGFCAECREANEERYRQSMLAPSPVVAPYSPPRHRRAGGMGLHIEAVEGE